MASHSPILLRALSWNLFHGRDHPPDPALHSWRSRLLRHTERGATHAQVNRPLGDEFAGVLGGWTWQVALLQEAPPRWLGPLARRCGASGASALTSRNLLAFLRAALGQLNPDLIASNEGGSNMLLVRAPGRILAVERVTLATDPERRRMLLARVEVAGGRRLAVACVHLSVPGTKQAAGEAVRGAERAIEFAGADPLIFGGDLNLRPAHEPRAFAELGDRLGLARPTGRHAIDHLLVRGLDVVEPPRALPVTAREVSEPDGLRVRLSDHAPVTATFGMR
jgi:endonuclease/exonuclease/phosphatase family metal-dependent hydrolase